MPAAAKQKRAATAAAPRGAGRASAPPPPCPPCDLSAPFSMKEAKRLGVGATALAKVVPAGVARMVGRDRFKKVDVVPDGHCGAYCLAVLRWSITREVFTPAQIHAQLADHVTTGCGALLPEQKALYARDVRRARYLESFDVATYCMGCSVNAAVIGETMDKRRAANSRLQVYNVVVVSFSPHNPVWTFFLTTGGNTHFQLLVRGDSTAEYVCPTFSPAEAREILAACGRAYPTQRTDPCDAVQHCMAVAEDFVYF